MVRIPRSCDYNVNVRHVQPPLALAVVQWRMQDFLKGGSAATLREARAKIVWPRPFLIKTTPIFERFGEKLHVLPVNPAVFDPDFC